MTDQEIEDLIQRWLEGTGEPGDDARLAAWLAADPGRMRRYARACRFDAAIRAELSASSTMRIRRSPWRHRSVMALAAAMVLIAGLALTMVLGPGGTADGGTVVLADGSRVVGGPGARWRPEPGSGDRFRLDAGRIDAEVEPRQDRPFIIATDHAEIRVVGTRFAVETGGDATVVTVAHGEVAVAPRHGPPLAVVAGGSATVTARGSVQRTVFVPAGDPVRLLRAFREAAPGDTIRLGPGRHATTHAGQPEADLDLVRPGTPEAWIRVVGEPGAELALTGWSGILVRDGRFIELRSLVLTPRVDQPVPGNGIRIEGPGPVRIADCRIADFPGSGIAAQGPRDLVVARSVVTGCGGGSTVGQGGIDISRLGDDRGDPDDGVVIEDVRVSGSQVRHPNRHAGPDAWTGGNGIGIAGSGTAAQVPVSVRRTVLHNNEGSGFLAVNVDGVRLDDVVMHRNSSGNRPRAELTLHGRAAVEAADTLLLPRPGGRAVERSRNAGFTFTRTFAWGESIDPASLPLFPGGNPLVPVDDEASRHDFTRAAR